MRARRRGGRVRNVLRVLLRIASGFVATINGRYLGTLRRVFQPTLFCVRSRIISMGYHPFNYCQDVMERRMFSGTLLRLLVKRTRPVHNGSEIVILSNRVATLMGGEGKVTMRKIGAIRSIVHRRLLLRAIRIMVNVLRRLGRREEYPHLGPVIARFILIGDIRRAREVVSTFDTVLGVVTIMLFLRFNADFIMHRIINVDRVSSKIARMDTCFLFQGATGIGMATVRKSILRIIRITRRARFTRLNRSHRRARLSMSILHLRCKVGDLRDATRRLLRFVVTGNLGRKFIMFVSRSSRALTNLLMDATSSALRARLEEGL